MSIKNSCTFGNVYFDECSMVLQGRKRKPGPIARGSKFCSWVSENGSLVVRWASEISLSSLVNDSFQSKTISKFMIAR